MARRRPRHHYLPAAFIARFSLSPALRARESMVWARNRGVGLAFLEKAENLGYVRGLYEIPEVAADTEKQEGEADEIDTAWRKVEERLTRALDLLVASRGVIDAKSFGEVLVPFVAGLFVRGWEFDQRFTERMDRMVGEDSALHEQFTSRRNINHARLMEMQRFFSPVMRAGWTVAANATDVPLITSDLGVLPWTAEGRDAMMVPLDPAHALVLHPRPLCPRIAFGTHEWSVDINTSEMSRAGVLRANRICSRVAPRQIYGPTEASIVSQQVEMLQRKPISRPEGVWGVPGRYLARTDLELYEFLVEIAQPPNELPRITRDEAIARMNWPLPMIALGTNKDAIYDDEEETELRLQEITARKTELDRLSDRFGPMEILSAPRNSE